MLFALVLAMQDTPIVRMNRAIGNDNKLLIRFVVSFAEAVELNYLMFGQLS
jgi:hypothetical protein